MNLDYLSEFLDLANTLNFTKTSKNLHLAQPTLSRHIAELEKQVGSPLFVRTTTSVKLTQAGRALYEKASLLLADYTSMVEQLRAENERSVETLRVSGSTVQPTGNRLFSRLALRASMEGLPFRIEYGPTRSLSNEPPVPYALDALKDGLIDFMIDTCPVDPKVPAGYEAIHLCDEQTTVLASSDNVLAYATSLKMKDLFANTLMGFAVQQHCTRVLFSSFLKAGYGANRTKTVFVDNILEIPEQLAKLSPTEIVVMQRNYCSAFGFDQDGMGKIVALDMDDPLCKSGFWAVYRKNGAKPETKQAIELLKTIIDEAKSNASEDDWSTENVLWSSALYTA